MGIVLFLFYFRIFNIPMQSEYTVMIQKLPAVLAVVTVPICSFGSFLATAKILVGKVSEAITAGTMVKIGLFSLVFTVAMDLLTTVVAEKMNILLFPVDLMYLFAWLAIIPANLLAWAWNAKRPRNHT